MHQAMKDQKIEDGCSRRPGLAFYKNTQVADKSHRNKGLASRHI